MSWTFFGRSNIAAGGTAPITTTVGLSSFTNILYEVGIVDGIAAAGSKDFFIYGGPNDVICALLFAMAGPDGEQIPVGAVATNTHTKLTFANNANGIPVYTLQIPAAGAALPANGKIYIYIVAGDPIKLNPINM